MCVVATGWQVLVKRCDGSGVSVDDWLKFPDGAENTVPTITGYV